MNPGDLIFVSGIDVISRIIRWVTESKYSHVAIYVGGGRVIEAQAFRKVGFQELAYYEGKYDVKPIRLREPQRIHGLVWILNQRGRPYSYWSDFVILLRCLFNIHIPWHEGLAIICSRLGRDFLFHCGLPIPDENMSPEDLYEWVTSYTRE
ncbi:hypothetical protein SD70_27160 [Gordoniibacillus kamchatkensis]|uniref:Uncharacterized protein n=2 Tax=Gordoniibacillus kamchatkensis TaxID=1590651 RepID=A0ABR5ABD6_9BACL|nr:hypothetical protein SD70_27160 [Paenibacillus sp. VKM B-2647]